jgi:hypothetical protein
LPVQDDKSERLAGHPERGRFQRIENFGQYGSAPLLRESTPNTSNVLRLNIESTDAVDTGEYHFGHAE